MGGGLLYVVLAAVCVCTAAQAQADTVRSADGERVAYIQARGWLKPLMTEIWTADADGSDPRRVKVYLGEPGDLFFLPGKEGFVYLQRSLSYAVFGSHLYGGRELSLIHNRVWRVVPDGSGEAPWPLPEDLQAVRIAVSPGGGRLAVCGYRGGLLDRGDRSLWVVDRSGKAVLVKGDGVRGPLGWSADAGEVFCALEEEGVLWSAAVAVETGETRKLEVLSGNGLAAMTASGDVLEGEAGPALALINKALDQYMRGYHAMHRDAHSRVGQERVQGGEAGV